MLSGNDIEYLFADPAREFTTGAEKRGEILSLAGTILAGPQTPLCLATEDKTLVAAAILARLCGGPEIFLPPGLSASVLARMQQDQPGVRLLRHRPDPDDKPPSLRPEPAGLDRELARIFTGGSTGRPQIWPKTGHNLLDEALFLARAFEIGTDDRILATVPPHHIYGLLFSVLVPLVSGAAVIPAQPSFPAEIRETARRHGATILVSVPPHYQALRDTPLDCASLRMAFSSAGPLAEAENRNFRTCNQVPVIEVFGSTETGGIGCRNRFAGEAGFTAFQPVVWRESDGLLAVRSPFLSPGLPLDDEGWFQTADRIRPLDNRVFIPRGRADAVAKVGGRRVNLEEIRDTIRGLAGIHDCVVAALPERGGRGSRIAALVAGEVEPETVRELAARQLEPHARPRIIRVVKTIPVRANGKHDRAAILELLHGRA
jgi:acyl-coenzyme A synthetase/AMP-(fatty) acid ligase